MGRRNTTYIGVRHKVFDEGLIPSPIAMWKVGEWVNIGWPDFGRPPRLYELVEVDWFWPVVRARVRDGTGKQGGFLIVYGCQDSVLEKLAAEATSALGFPVVASELRPSINGASLRSFDYEWWPTPEFTERPNHVARTIATLLAEMNGRGEA